jgi:endonuclease YncB( thermonuclease family)
MKKTALVLAMFGFASAAYANPYDMKVTKVTDGDTIRVEAPWLLPELGDDIAIRILGIDTPEKGGRAKCEAEAALGAEATEFAKSVIAVGDVVQVDVLQWDKFGGRINADVYVDGENFAQMQIERGLAVPYDGGTKDSWCD